MRREIIMQYDFPAIFYPDDGAVAFHFYDNDDWFSCGDDIADAIEMAEDVLGGSLMRAEREGKEIPKPTPLDKVKLSPSQVVRMIHADTEKYAKELEEQLQRERVALSENPIKAIRELRGWNIKELAEYLNAPYRTIQDWNSGKVKPPKWIQDIIVEKIYSA